MKNLWAGALKVGFIVVLFYGGITTEAQYKITGKLMDVEGVYHDVIVVLKNSGNSKNVRITNDGRFETYLDWNSQYFFSFSKPGYVTKVIEFSTNIPDQIYPETITPYYLPVRLFKVFEGVDTVFFNHPIAKISYDQEFSDFMDDRDYSLQVKYKIEQMRMNAIKNAEQTVRSTPKSVQKNKAAVLKPKNVDTKKVVVKEKDVAQGDVNYGLPPLKTTYPEGRTDEVFVLERKVVERTIFVRGGARQVLYVVKHDWGGKYYFVEKIGRGYKCVSKDAYENLIQNNQTLISSNK